jgi:type 1 glutamine amidotransferase
MAELISALALSFAFMSAVYVRRRRRTVILRRSGARNYSKGRVFMNALLHENQIYDRPGVQKMFVEEIKWAMGLVPGDATPRPRPAR